MKGHCIAGSSKLTAAVVSATQVATTDPSLGQTTTEQVPCPQNLGFDGNCNSTGTNLDLKTASQNRDLCLAGTGPKAVQIPREQLTPWSEPGLEAQIMWEVQLTGPLTRVPPGFARWTAVKLPSIAGWPRGGPGQFLLVLREQPADVSRSHAELGLLIS